MRIYRGGKYYMFEKIKYLIDMGIIGFWYSFYTNYMKGLNNDLGSELLDILDRPSKYIIGLSGGESDYNING